MSIDISTQPGIIAGTWTIDLPHSEVGFTVRHLMTKVRGEFQKFEGTITTGENVADTRVQASIDLSSVNTHSEQRDGHLRSSDFFEADKTGPMTFTTTTFDGSVAIGDLTIKGVTHPVELEVTYLGIQDDAYGNTRIGFEATTEISRKKFGVDFNVPLDGGKVLIGDKVSIELSAQAILNK